MALNVVDWKQAATGEARVEALLGQMTVDEKLAQIAAVWVTSVIDQSRQFNMDKMRAAIRLGIGHITRIGAASLLLPPDSSRLANTIQRFLVNETRLGIPAIVHEESCAGYMARGATTFPHALGQAATWEPALIEDMAKVINRQMRAVGAHQTLAPVLDVARDPRWGRTEETFGEDPFLISAVGTAYIRGLQGPDWSSRVVATAKHFLGHGWSEGGLNWAPAHIPERELREIFLTPFAAAIREAGAASVMPAYHELDGVPLHASTKFLVDVLRGELGFDGVISADYFGINMLAEYHHVAADKSEAAVQALQAGIDVELPGVACYGSPLKDALEAGRIDISLIDACVSRVLLMKSRLGLFDDPFVDEGRVLEIFSDPAPRDLSLELARKSLVLLKNDGLLPLSKAISRIAVIGPCANTPRALQGDYHYPSHLEGIFDPDVSQEAPSPHEPSFKLDLAEHFPPSVTVLEGIRAQIPAAQITFAQGCDFLGTDTSRFAAAVEAARNAEIAIVAIGDKSGLAKGATSGESIDRATLGLPGVQQQLVEAIAATGTPVVVLLLNGRPLAISWIADHIPAVLECWQPGERAGEAIAEALFGDANPGGRLPISFPRSVGQVPVYYNHKPSGGRSHWHGSYIDESTVPLFPFGHGLSYTRFEYADLTVAPQQTDAHGMVQISVTVRNVGEQAGDEVVQLYVGDPVASVTRPVQALKGFKRITLEPGESRRVTFNLDVRHLAFYDRVMRYIVEPGQITIGVGSSSADIRLSGAFEITGEATPVEQVYSTPVVVE